MYGDFEGRIFVDGFNGGLFGLLRSVSPPRFHPVGLEISYRAEPQHWAVSLLFADPMILDESLHPREGIARYIAENGDLPVFRQPTDYLTIEELLKHVKRLHVSVHDKCIDGSPLRIVTEE